MDETLNLKPTISCDYILHSHREDVRRRVPILRSGVNLCEKYDGIGSHSETRSYFLLHKIIPHTDDDDYLYNSTFIFFLTKLEFWIFQKYSILHFEILSLSTSLLPKFKKIRKFWKKCHCSHPNTLSSMLRIPWSPSFPNSQRNDRSNSSITRKSTRCYLPFQSRYVSTFF